MGKWCYDWKKISIHLTFSGDDSVRLYPEIWIYSVHFQILKISGSQNLATAGITFNTGLSIDGDVTVTGTVNGYTIPDDLVLLAGAQTINSGNDIEFMNRSSNLLTNTLVAF